MRANINKYPLNKQIASRVSVLGGCFLHFLFVGLFLSIVKEETLQLTLLSLVINACVSVNPVYFFFVSTVVGLAKYSRHCGVFPL